MDEDGLPPETPGEPDSQPGPAPFAPEDGVYQAIVSEYVGLQRAGADVISAALITAAHLMYLGLANAGASQSPTEE